MKTILKSKSSTTEKIGYKRQGVSYNLVKERWIELFNLIEQTGNISLIARTYEIKRPTLSKKYRAWKNKSQDPSIDRRGSPSKVFSVEDERVIMNILWSQACIIGSHVAFSDNNIKDVAFSVYDYLRKYKKMKPLTLSATWAIQFKQRHGISNKSYRVMYHMWTVLC